MTERGTARRLKTLRHWTGCGSQTQFAEKYGFTPAQWNNFERGYPLSKEAAIRLVEQIQGLTLDWLHLGRADGLPGILRAELEEAEKIAARETSPEG
jgi:transcriptional regulator with XRE-family HTH domain